MDVSFIFISTIKNTKIHTSFCTFSFLERTIWHDEGFTFVFWDKDVGVIRWIGAKIASVLSFIIKKGPFGGTIAFHIHA
jgi:hypothetical protein